CQSQAGVVSPRRRLAEGQHRPHHTILTVPHRSARPVIRATSYPRRLATMTCPRQRTGGGSPVHATTDDRRIGLRPQVDRWLGRRSSRAGDWPLSRLMAAKVDTSISVVVPARDEESTVGSIVATIHRRLMREVPLVDELVVVDSCSTDGTALVAEAA